MLHTLPHSLEHEGCRLVRYTGSLERRVVTRTVCAEGSLVLVSGAPDLGDQSKAALGSQGKLSHNSFYRAGASHQSTALMLKI